MANADTPGFRARDLAGFAETYRSRVSAEMRGTRPGHLTGASWGGAERAVDDGGEPAPNGNTVSLEEEMIRIAETRRDFDVSLAVTRSAIARATEMARPPLMQNPTAQQIVENCETLPMLGDWRLVIVQGLALLESGKAKDEAQVKNLVDWILSVK